MRTGIVYTETFVHTAVPYQVMIVSLDGGGRITARTAGGERLQIGDRVIEADSEDGVPYFRKS